MKIELLGDRVLLKVEESRKKTESGIILAETAVGKSQIGKVIETGTGRVAFNGNTIPMKVSNGDRVMFDKFAGDTILIENEEYLIVNETSIIAILKKD